jgi:hypothetical protein
MARLGRSKEPLLPGERIGKLSATPLLLLGLEAVWARGADVTIFTVAGLDPVGRQTIFQAISSRLPQCAAIYLSHVYTTQGRWERDHCPHASCLELTDQEAGLGGRVLQSRFKS